ncbi:MAG: metallophosphatase domain-containing protein [Chitinophagales bacterium]
MKITFLSDTHGQHRNKKLQLLASKMIVHAGDFTSMGTLAQVNDFLEWYSELPHPHKVLIGGNHDFLLERNPQLFKSLLPNNITYLENESIEIEGIKIWGSPITPWFYDWAFNRHRGQDIRRYWEQIPDDVDILVTHGPPYGQGDKTSRGELVGCEDLLEKVLQIKPKYHIFGHIHEAYSISQNDATTFINASCLNLNYQMVHAPVCIDF